MSDKEEKKNYAKALCRTIKNLFEIKHFKQQRLPAWRPIFTVTTVVPTFMLTAFALIVIGIGFLYMSSKIKYFELDYTDCIPLHGTKTCSQILSDWRIRYNESWPPPECVCWYKFELEHDFEKNVFVYYGLYNYFQSHLHYVRSRDMSQFRGERSASSDCRPFQYKRVLVNGQWTDRPIVPCGTVANSMFNDTFTFWRLGKSRKINNSIIEVPLSRTGIAWTVDHSNYRNPNRRGVFRNFTNPPFWGNNTIWDLDPDNPRNNGLQNEALIVWMRVAAFPDFWKLYARVVRQRRGPFKELLPRGHYYLKIQYNYPVSSFKGRKSFIITNTNRNFGGSYFFLGVLYLVVGGLCAIGTIVIFIIHKRFAISKEECIDINVTTPYFYKKVPFKSGKY